MRAKRTKQPPRGTEAAKSCAAITVLPVDRLHPNEYNPIRMTKAEYAELVAEVRHLNRLPKPVVVRPNGDGYTIVDGEHGWRAANDVGLSEVPCEVIDADDFECMRQTYKRNQHGTHDPLRLGRMFRRMMEDRNLSARALAEEIAVSEGTVRNAVMYAEAADMRNSYAPAIPDENEKKISALSVRQVRCYVKLGGRLADLWLNAKADLSLVNPCQTREMIENGAHWAEDAGVDGLRRLAETGLFEFVGRVYGRSGFEDAVRKVRAWHAWEWHWLRHDIDAKEFRGYSRHFFKGSFYIRTEDMMDDALVEILDTESDPPTFLLTADEFAAVLARTGKGQKESHLDFLKRLSLAVSEKTGQPPRETKHDVHRRLLEKQLESAPDYIRQSSLPLVVRLALWKVDGPEEAKREIARLILLPDEAGCRPGHEDYDIRWHLKNLIEKWVRRHDFDVAWESQSRPQLAARVAADFGIYDPQKDGAAIHALAGKLAALTKDELFYLSDHIRRLEISRAWRGEPQGQAPPARADGSGEVVGECYDADPVSVGGDDHAPPAE
jgi:ParB family chromosome partitioning protein